MEELIIIRHGQAEHHLAGMVGGWSDSSLTNVGQSQALKTGNRLKEFLRDREYGFFCSDLSRASDTAEIIGSVLGRDPVAGPELRELNNGIAANKSKDEAKLLELPATAPILDWISYPQAESWNMLHVRVAAFMEELDKDCRHTAVVVTHSNTANAIVHWWLGFTKEMIEKVSFEFDPCSMTHLTITNWNRNKTIRKLNDTAHLQAAD